MITVKKDAIKVKTSEGMQSAGVLCKVGTFGTNWLELVDSISFCKNTYNTNSLPEIVDIDLPCLRTSTQLFWGNSDSTPRVIKLGLNSEVIYQASRWFEYCRKLEFLEFKGGVKLSVINSLFNQCGKLKEVRGAIDLSTSWQANAPFAGCTLLEEIRFVENSIPISIPFNPCGLLSDASVQSIIDGLMDLTGQTAQTITFHADVKAKLTDEQIATITSKNWTIP